MDRRLVLLRHAKSSWADPDLADHDRPLSGRGRRAARVIGRYLRNVGMLPDLVLCSSATRARETLVRLDLPTATDVRIEDEIYGADPDELFTRLRTVSSAVGSVLLIGHNPSIEELAGMLVDDALALPDRYPTAALADLRLPIASWQDLGPHVGWLERFVTPRELEGAG